MDNRLVTDAVFLDLSKAFDSVDHQLLLKKLKSRGLDINSMDWLVNVPAMSLLVIRSSRLEIVSLDYLSWSTPR